MLEKWLLVPDVHVPYHDAKAVALMLRAAEAIKIKNVALLGDFADMFSVSSHAKSPDARCDLQWEIDQVNDLLSVFDAQFEGKKKFVAGNHECLTPDHQILTRVGWVPIAEADTETEIATMTPDGYLAWQAPIKVHSYPFEGKIAAFGNKGPSFRATLNHRLAFWPQGDESQPIQYRTVEELQAAGPQTACETPVSLRSTNADFVGVSDDELRLLGWILTDGCLSNYPVIYQSKVAGRNKIRALLKRLDLDFTESERVRPLRPICGVDVKTALPGGAFRFFGADSKNRIAQLMGFGDVWDRHAPNKKKLPAWTTLISDRQFEVLLEAVLDGDGSRHKRSPEAEARIALSGRETSYSAACLYGVLPFLEAFQILCVLHGYGASIRSRTRKGVHSFWVLNLKKRGHYRVMSSDIELQDYSGPVHCVTTDNSNFLVRHNGSVHVTGNSRLERYLTDRAPALFGTVKVEQLLDLKGRGWEYTRYKDYTKIGKLHLTHDVGKAGPNAHRDAMNAFQGNVVLGHTHRLAYCVEGSVKGQAHIGAMLGWLGDPTKTDYMFRVKAARDWAHGFGVAYKENNGCVHVVPVPIVNGKVVVEGKLIK